MLPYPGDLILHITPSWSVSPFGPLVATGILVGRQVAMARAQELGIPRREIALAAMLGLTFGLFAAHALDEVFYYPDRLAREGLPALFKFWRSMSSFGGFIGAISGVGVARLMIGHSVQKHLDCNYQGFIVGWVFGRLGCTLLFDHPGVASTFVLAFDHPLGPRHNLGFYELLYTMAVLVPASWFVYARGDRKRMELLGRTPSATDAELAALPRIARPGAHCAIAAMLYAPVRFVLDVLRADEAEGGDRRLLWHLTWGQFCCVALLGVGIWLWRHPPPVRDMRPPRLG